jgi:hypothetical protein
MENSGLVENKRVAYFEYDFDRDGGGVGDIEVGGDVIPSGAIIHDGIIHVKAAVTSGGSATVAIKALTSEDIKAATGKSTYSLNAILPTVPVGDAATAIRVTSNITELTFTVADAALTAGKICVALEYYMTA